jgi:hypothetical protein
MPDSRDLQSLATPAIAAESCRSFRQSSNVRNRPKADISNRQQSATALLRSDDLAPKASVFS